MEYLEIIKKRKSCKNFSDAMIPSEIIDKVVKAGNMAPIGMGKPENFHITVIKSKEILGEIDKTAANLFRQPESHPLYGALVLIVISAYEISDRSRMTYGCTAGCIAENMMLEAVNEHVDSVCMTGIIRAINNNENLLASLELPEGFTPIFSVALGYSNYSDDTIRDFNMKKIERNDV